MIHAAEPSSQDFKRYHGRALRSRLPSPVSAGTMGPNVYRLQWSAQLCAAAAMFASGLAALPSVSTLTGAPARRETNASASTRIEPWQQPGGDRDVPR